MLMLMMLWLVHNANEFELFQIIKRAIKEPGKVSLLPNESLKHEKFFHSGKIFFKKIKFFNKKLLTSLNPSGFHFHNNYYQQ